MKEKNQQLKIINTKEEEVIKMTSEEMIMAQLEGIEHDITQLSNKLLSLPNNFYEIIKPVFQEDQLMRTTHNLRTILSIHGK